METEVGAWIEDVLFHPYTFSLVPVQVNVHNIHVNETDSNYKLDATFHQTGNLIFGVHLIKTLIQATTTLNADWLDTVKSRCAYVNKPVLFKPQS